MTLKRFMADEKSGFDFNALSAIGSLVIVCLSVGGLIYHFASREATALEKIRVLRSDVDKIEGYIEQYSMSDLSPVSMKLRIEVLESKVRMIETIQSRREEPK